MGMEKSANFIPLGHPPGEPSPGQGRVKVIGKTKEERKEIARKIRSAAKKEKKLIKADAKKQRKQNAIMNRRATRNPEKYSKNKERNNLRAIDFERQKIRYHAVRQAEHLAAKYDPSGKMFNVGEIVVMPDGQVKSKAAVAKAAEEKVKRDAERAEEEALRKAKEEFKEARRAAHRATMKGEEIPEGVLNRAFYEKHPQPQKLSKQQQRRQEMLRPKPTPPKPLIPEGYSIPDGEENFLALWDITDEDIRTRISGAKRHKKTAAKDLRRVQKEAKKFNRAMKVKKKMAANAGILWDPERAKKEILAQANGRLEEEQAPDSGSGSGADLDSNSDSETRASLQLDGNDNGNNNGSGVHTELETTISNDSSVKPNGQTCKQKKLGKFPGVRLNLELLAKAEEIERARQQKKREARDRRRAERKAALAKVEKSAEEARVATEAAKAVERAARREAKRKAIEEEEADRMEVDKEASELSKKRKRPEYEEILEPIEKGKKDKSHKKKKIKSEDCMGESKSKNKSKKAKVTSDDGPVDLLSAIEEQLVEDGATIKIKNGPESLNVTAKDNLTDEKKEWREKKRKCKALECEAVEK